nr:iron chelate uptake ABC transporter family permease subunit [Streptomyces akebiae]
MRLSRIQSQTHSKNQGSIGQNGFDGVLQMLPVAATGLVGLLLTARRVDARALGDDAARGLGVPVRATRVTSRARLGFLAVAVLLSSTAVASAGTIGFVGLVAPHAARALGGRRHARVVPVAVLLGAALVCTADLLGRTVIAPAQLGAGMMTAVIGTPYFLHLLIRSRR